MNWLLQYLLSSHTPASRPLPLIGIIAQGIHHQLLLSHQFLLFIFMLLVIFLLIVMHVNVIKVANLPFIRILWSHNHHLILFTQICGLLRFIHLMDLNIMLFLSTTLQSTFGSTILKINLTPKLYSSDSKPQQKNILRNPLKPYILITEVNIRHSHLILA